MATKYKIYLVNQLSNAKKFWCFLEQPISQVNSEVYANSSAFITVPKYIPGKTDSFTIPLQYKVGAGTSNKAVGLNTVVESTSIANTDLEQGWLATYTQDGNNVGPIITQDGVAGSGQINMGTNLYDKSQEPLNQWYGNMTFGIESENGFIGMTWSPDPSETYMIEPKVNFYIATGQYSQNELASISAISSDAAHITAKDFDGARECTVTKLPNGSWDVSPGKPNPNLTMLAHLVSAHHTLVETHNTLVQLLQNPVVVATAPENTLLFEGTKECVSEGIVLNPDSAQSTDAIITGTITVGCAIAAGFAYMIASGITVKITSQSGTGGGTRFKFKYDGSAAASSIKDAFNVGSIIKFFKD